MGNHPSLSPRRQIIGPQGPQVGNGQALQAGPNIHSLRRSLTSYGQGGIPHGQRHGLGHGSFFVF